MTRSRYRFSTSPGSHQYFDNQSASTIDVAIEEAKRIARGTKSATYKVYVSDTAAIPHLCRGFAVGNKWVWMKKCKVCKGAGVIPVRMPNKQTFNAPCEKCGETGAVPDV